MKSHKILVVEDEPDILEVLEYNLVRGGYRVATCRDGEAALEMALKVDPDLVLLDLMLPGCDGIEVCKRLKADPVTRSARIVMVTAKGEESDIVLGLGVGADDYVRKPFTPKELLARVQAVLRRGPLEPEGGAERLVRDGVVIDLGRHEVLLGDEALEFTATELRLLHFLASHPGRVFTRDQLIGRVIGEDVIVIDRNIDVHVRAIRKKLGDRRTLIETIRGVGYRFRDVDV